MSKRGATCSAAASAPNIIMGLSMVRSSVLRAAVCLCWLAISCELPSFGQERVVNVSGWSDYIDPDVIRDFTKETGIEVTYDPYDSDEMLEAQLKPGKAPFDVVIVSGRALPRQIAAGFYLKLDKSKLPNARYLWPDVMALLAAYDPGNQYAVNYIWFTVGIAYDAEKAKRLIIGSQADRSRRVSTARLSVPSLDSWGLLFKPENLKKLSGCGVAVLDSPEDLLAIARRYVWADWSLASGLSHETDLKRAADLLNGIRRDVKKIDASKYVAALGRGEICLAVGYSLDTLRARNVARELKNGVEINYALPKEGSPILLDNLAIPKGAAHVEEAYEFIDFLLRPEIAARNTNLTHAANGVLASKPSIDKKISNDKSIYPDRALMQRLFVPERREFAAQNAFARDGARTKLGGWPR
jgi:putrescine transport system substrate-binding protein